MNVHRIIVQIGSSWESCSWSLIFWAPNPGFHVLHLGVTKSTSPRRWPLRQQGHDAAQRNHGVPQLQQREERRGTPSIWVEVLGASMQKIMQNPNLDAQSQWGVWFFSLMMCVYCYSFWSTQRSRFWFLVYAFVMFEGIWPLKKAVSICLWKLLSRPAQVKCQKEHWVVKMMAINHCLISIGVKKQSVSQHHGLF